MKWVLFFVLCVLMAWVISHLDRRARFAGSMVHFKGLLIGALASVALLVFVCALLKLVLKLD